MGEILDDMSFDIESSNKLDAVFTQILTVYLTI